MSRPEFTEHLAQDRRLVILRQLEAAPGYTLNESVLDAVLERYGHHVSRDTVRADLAWLEEQALVTLEQVAGRIQVATSTARGVEVATGQARHPGVKRPSPRR